MFVFTENLSKTSDDFVFKGGNLLWLYIHTPRATVDLDFATKSIVAHREVRSILERAGQLRAAEIEFRIVEFKEISQQGESGAAVRVEYRTHDGAKNFFDLDIVYAIGTNDTRIPSPIQTSHGLRVSALEKIITDKIVASHRFKGGNTRMKDFDDLWRISKSGKSFDTQILRNLLKAQAVGMLNPEWVDPKMEAAWQSHRKRYQDLPETLGATIDAINIWLKTILA